MSFYNMTAKMNGNQSFFSMAQESQDVIEAGIELYKHYLYELNPSKNRKYEAFSQGKSYQEKNEIFNKNLHKEAVAFAAGNNPRFNDHAIRTNQQYQWAKFAIMSEILDVVLPLTVLDNFYQFVDIRNLAWGESALFSVQNPDLFVVSKVANGVRKSIRQRLFNKDYTAQPIARMVTVGDEFYRIITGKVDFGAYVTRIAQSFETQITTDIFNALTASFSDTTLVPSAYTKTGAFDQASLTELVELVGAANMGATPIVIGTKTALSKVVPDDQYFRFQLGDQYNENGFLGNFQGINMLRLSQRLVPNTDTLALDNSKLYIVSQPFEKLIKLVFEGGTIARQTNQGDAADNHIEYNLEKRYDVLAVTSARYGVYSLS